MKSNYIFSIFQAVCQRNANSAILVQTSRNWTNFIVRNYFLCTVTIYLYSVYKTQWITSVTQYVDLLVAVSQNADIKISFS